MLLDFTGKVALVTGGSRGIGRATAIALAEAGADVAINYVRDDAAAEATATAVRATGRRCLVTQADIAQRAEVEAMVERVAGEFGHLDIAICSAAVVTRTPFLELTDEEFDWVISTNLRGAFLVGQTVARQMVKQGQGGKIVNLTSDAAERGVPAMSHYCASKGGLRQLTRTMALELAPHGINVNAVAPGTTATDINRDFLTNPENMAQRLSRIAIGRFNQVQDVVGAILFLASSASDTMVGATIAVDGGSTAS